MELFLTNASKEINTIKSSMTNESELNKRNIELAEKNIEKIRQAFEENKDKLSEEDPSKDDDSSKEESQNNNEDKNDNKEKHNSEENK